MTTTYINLLINIISISCSCSSFSNAIIPSSCSSNPHGHAVGFLQLRFFERMFLRKLLIPFCVRSSMPLRRRTPSTSNLSTRTSSKTNRPISESFFLNAESIFWHSPAAIDFFLSRPRGSRPKTG